MTKEILLEKIKGDFSKKQLESWIKSLPGKNVNGKPATYKQGDIIFHHNLQHPVVLAKKRKGHWVGVTLTTNPNCPECEEPCASRFVPDSYFTRNLIALSIESIPGYQFMGVYGKSVLPIYNRIKNQL